MGVACPGSHFGSIQGECIGTMSKALGMENQVSLSVLIMNKGQSSQPPISSKQLADRAAQLRPLLYQLFVLIESIVMCILLSSSVLVISLRFDSDSKRI